MPIPQFRTVHFWPEDQQERNAGFQASNPNVVTTAPTPSTASTEVTQPQETNNPANNGVVPTSTGWAPATTDQKATPGQIPYTQDEMNKQLTAAGITMNPWAYNNELEKTYGIGNYGMSADQVKELPESFYDANGNYVVRDVQSYKLSAKTSEKYRKFQEDFSKIKIQGKQANSGAWIDQDFGVGIQEAQNLLRLMLNTEAAEKAYKSNDAAVQLVTQSLGLLKSLQPGTPEYQNAATKFKLDLAEFAQKISNNEFGKYGWSTALTDSISDYIRNIRSLGELYKMDESGLTTFVQNAERSFEKTTVQYKQLKDMPSVKIKWELMQNKTYQDFLKTAYEKHPEFRKQIEWFMTSTTLWDEEKKFIDTVFVGKYAANFFEAKKAYAEQFWTFAAAKAFAWFEDIMNIKNAQYESAEDDLLKYGDWGSFQFSLNSWQGNTPYRTTSTWQSGWQSYNTRQASTRSVDRTIW
jgi:hypothetical protein